jgi:alpha-galactosidase
MSVQVQWVAAVFCGVSLGFALAVPATEGVAPAPPMGWNDWAHYQCDFTADTVLANAQALVKSGLAARGYNTVTIDDCWMTAERDSDGNLQPDLGRFPHGMKPVADAVHALGLKFGIYEDSGYMTCGRFAGSGAPDGGGNDHFVADARLFASWGVDYLKLDGCNVFVPKGDSKNHAYEMAYRAERDALNQVDRPIVFSESAPAYFQGTPDWYDVLSWVPKYGQLWREGDDIGTYDQKDPNHPRFDTVLWNYSYHLPLGRFQKPGKWNDADFIIGGDAGMTPVETRSQMALWSMMASPLILSLDVAKLSPESVKILGNPDVIAVDQDPLGRAPNLLRRDGGMDVLIKPLKSGAYAVAAFNYGMTATAVELHAADLGFNGNSCHLQAQDLWTEKISSGLSSLSAQVASHDTAVWRVTPGPECGTTARQGVIARIIPDGPSATHTPAEYARCLAAVGKAERCTGSAAESWQVLAGGRLRSGTLCLAAAGAEVKMAACDTSPSQHWDYDLAGRLVSHASGQCLTAASDGALSVSVCTYNPASQVWSLPGTMSAESPAH